MKLRDALRPYDCDSHGTSARHSLEDAFRGQPAIERNIEMVGAAGRRSMPSTPGFSGRRRFTDKGGLSYRCIVGGTAGGTRTPISRFWRPVLCLLSFCRNGMTWLRDVGSNHARSWLTARRSHPESHRGFASISVSAGKRALTLEAAAGFDAAMDTRSLALLASAFNRSATPLLSCVSASARARAVAPHMTRRTAPQKCECIRL